MTKIAVAFQCEACNTFSTHFRTATAVINVKVVLQNVGKYPKKIWWGVLMNLKLIVEFYTAFKGKLYHQCHDTQDMEWPRYRSSGDF